MADDELRSDLSDSTDPAKGATLVGMSLPDMNALPQTVRELLLQQPVNAASFGFSTSNIATDNAAAVARAATFANGRPVVVDAADDYRLNSLCIDGTLDTVDLTFTGKGSVLHDDTDAGNLISFTALFAGGQSVISMSVVTTTVQGTPDREATAIVLADVSKYRAGDFIRIFSDDIDPDARTGYTARRGEVAYITEVSSGTDTIYTSRLEDFEYYTTNVRVARYSRSKFKLRGLRVKSSSQTLNAFLVHLTACVGAQVEASATGVGPNASGVRMDACVFSDIVFNGSGNVDSTQLNYGVTDARGYGNVVRNSTGYGWRHFVTTAFNSVAEGSADPAAYGAPRDLTVRDCIALGCGYAPFDEHEGARRTRFINCIARFSSGDLTGQAYNARGKDTLVDNCYADASFGTAIKVNSARGIVRVADCLFECSLTESFESAGRYPDMIIFKNCTVRLADMPNTGLLGRYLTRVHVVIDGGTYEISGVRDSASAARVFYLAQSTPNLAPTLEFVGDPLVVISANPSAAISSLIIQSGVTDAYGTVYGRLRIKNDAGVPLATIISRASGSNSASVDLEIDWLSGEYTNVVNATSGFSYLKYRLINRSTRPMAEVNYQSREFLPVVDIARNPDIANTQLVASSVSNTVVRLKMLGSDNVVRSVDLTLT